MKIYLNPIGYVRNSVVNPKEAKWDGLISKIIVYKKYEPALKRIDGHTYLFVIFWMHKTSKEERALLQLHPGRQENFPLVGAFALRTPARPNPLGLGVVKLLNVNDNILQVEHLDALNGSPVLDIKPYDQSCDVQKDAKNPDWWARFLDLKLPWVLTKQR